MGRVIMGKIKTKLVSLVTAFMLVFTLVSLMPQTSLKASAATQYKLWLYETQVTSQNASDILGDGSASYDAASKTLTIKKSISRKGYAINNQLKGLKVRTTQALTLESTSGAGMYIAEDITIETKGKLTVKTPHGYLAFFISSMMSNSIIVTVKNADIEFSGWGGFHGYYTRSILSIINSHIKINAISEDRGAINGFIGGVYLTNCFVKTPEKPYIYNGAIYTDSTAKTVATSVEICKGRLAGSNRYDTAAVISKATYDKASNVVLASGKSYADALAGVPLATKLNAPILLTDPTKLSAETLTEIKRLGAKNVTILGGYGAVSKNVETMLVSNGCKVSRIQGSTRYGTAAAVADKIDPAPTTLFFVYGLDYADALSVSPVASVMGAPIIYLNKDGSMNAETASYLAALKKKGCVRTAYVIGGEGVISKNMMQKAADALGLVNGKQITRTAGANRYETCMNVNAKFFSSVSNSMICVATGLDFPDALAGGVFAAKHASMLFLVSGKASAVLSNDQKDFLEDKSPNGMAIFGGTGAVSDKTVSDINAVIKK